MFHQFLAAAPCFSMSVPCSGWQEGHSGQGSHQFPAFIHMLTTGSWLLGELYFLTFICGAFHLATDFSLSMLIFLTGLAVAQCLKMQKRELQAAVPFLPGRCLWSWGPPVAQCRISGTDRVPSLALHLAHHVCVSKTPQPCLLAPYCLSLPFLCAQPIPRLCSFHCPSFPCSPTLLEHSVMEKLLCKRSG